MMHQLLKGTFAEGVGFATTTETVAENASMPAGSYVKITVHEGGNVPRDNRSRQQQQERGGGRKKGQDDSWRHQEPWPGGSRRHLQFLLYKENMETQVAINQLSRYLHVRPNLLSIAGTKDKRAVTVQRVTAFKVSAKKVQDAANGLVNIECGNYEYAQHGIWLGALAGNAFQITLRDITAETDDQVQAALQGLTHFINYYGLQRFGHSTTPTHKIGALMLKGNWEAAVKLLLMANPKDAPDVRKARLAYSQRHNIQEALDAMPRYMVAEYTILQVLHEEGPHNYRNALLAIPRNLRTLYGHAFQSYVWNCAASHRVKTFGLNVVKGDLVLPRNVAATLDGGPEDAADIDLGGQDDADCPAAAAPALEAAGGFLSNGAGPHSGTPATVNGEGAHGGMQAPRERSRGRLGAVKVVTQADVEADTYDITEVVLPLPGEHTQLPQHSTGQVMRDVAAEFGLDLVYVRDREMSLGGINGDYRYVVQRPNNLRWKLFRYSDANAELASSDLQILQGGPSHDEVLAAAEDPAGPCLGLRLNFELPSSCYATMLLRELMKTSTASGVHAKMTKDARDAADNDAGYDPELSE